MRSRLGNKSDIVGENSPAAAVSHGHSGQMWQAKPDSTTMISYVSRGMAECKDQLCQSRDAGTEVSYGSRGMAECKDQLRQSRDDWH